MNGAALSNLLSYGLYIALTITLVAGLCRIRVIEKKWWLILLLLLMLFALNQLWTLYMPSLNIWLDSLLRSLLIIGSGLLIAYKAELSPEINQTLRDLVISKYRK